MNIKESELRKGDSTLTDRGVIYGPYSSGLSIREDIIKAIELGYKKHHKADMPDRYKSYFWDIANKLCRLSISPLHEDSWHDIVGYSKLIELDVKETNDKIKKSNTINK